jgi:hypothetical protein
MASLPPQDQVHDPAASYMLPRLAAMLEDVGVVAARFLKGVKQNAQ